MLGMPRGTTLEKLTFGDIVSASSAIIGKVQHEHTYCKVCVCVCVEHSIGLKELYSRAQGEVSIREALRELELWGVGASFNLTNYTDSARREISIIKDWKELVNQVKLVTLLPSSPMSTPLL